MRVCDTEMFKKHCLASQSKLLKGHPKMTSTAEGEGVPLN